MEHDNIRQLPWIFIKDFTDEEIIFLKGILLDKNNYKSNDVTKYIETLYFHPIFASLWCRTMFYCFTFEKKKTKRKLIIEEKEENELSEISEKHDDLPAVLPIHEITQENAVNLPRGSLPKNG